MRAMWHLSRGDLAGAVADNVLAVAVVAAFTITAAMWAWRVRHGDRRPFLRTGPIGAPGAAFVWAVLIVAFTVARNLPIGAALAPG